MTKVTELMYANKHPHYAGRINSLSVEVFNHRTLTTDGYGIPNEYVLCKAINDVVVAHLRREGVLKCLEE